MKPTLWGKIKYFLWGRAVFSDKFYNIFLRRFDRILFDVVSTKDLMTERRRRIPMNKICQVADLYHPAWRDVLSELKLPLDKRNFHRKAWEHVQIIFSLKRMKLLTPASVCLAVGAGRENLLYYLTYKVKKVWGIDLYEGKYFGGEDEADILLSAQKYAPFPYSEDKLHLMRMDALNLEFDDNSFDFIFSSSSIEHFGSEEEILKSLKEMYRVLKPGGVAFLTTELRLNKVGSSIKNIKVLTFQKLILLFRDAGFTIKQDSDLRAEKEYLDDWIKLPDDVFKRPHVILRYFNTILTSIHIGLHKEGIEAIKGDEKKVSIPDFTYRGIIKISADKKKVKKRENVNLDVTLINRSNFTWIPTGYSHRISLGVKLFTDCEELVERDYSTLILPREVTPGDKINFSSQIRAPSKRGLWILRFDLKKELVIWFSQRENPTFDLKLEVF